MPGHVIEYLLDANKQVIVVTNNKLGSHVVLNPQDPMEEWKLDPFVGGTVSRLPFKLINKGLRLTANEVVEMFNRHATLSPENLKFIKDAFK